MYSFYAFLFRMKYINRWGLMKSTSSDNVAEHSQHTALVAHALALIEKRIFNNQIDENKVGMIALFHETGEVLTGDLPTPIKYFSTDIEKAYKGVESIAEKTLLSKLPSELMPDIQSLVTQNKDSIEYKLVKCADKICAYIKCIEEKKSNNSEFNSAYKTIKSAVDSLCKTYQSVNYFVKNLLPAYSKTLDEL